MPRIGKVPWLDVNTDKPDEPKFADRWSLVHWFSGFAAMYVLLCLQARFMVGDYSWAILGVLVIIHQAWEYYEEVYQGIPTWVGSKENTIGDTLFFTLGALVAAALYNLPTMNLLKLRRFFLPAESDHSCALA